ncbi:MAG: class II fumarate hydratase, partial [Tissierellia bacterium]|nr:class II fumarate hydratase [Tissierellia bacterium]
MDYRIEKDTIGEIKVPSDRYWGAQTERSYENFPIGEEKMPKSLIRAMAVLKQATAIANNRYGKLDNTRCELIKESAQKIISGQYSEEFPLSVWQTGSGTQSNMNMNEVISHIGNEIYKEEILHPNDHVNMSQSSNDVFPSSMHIAAYKEIKEVLLPSLNYMKEVLIKLEKENEGIVKIGRTHLQDATPIKFSQEIMGW